MHSNAVILLLLLADNGIVVARRKASDAAHELVPRDGTLCRLTSRDILCKTAPQVHRLRFALPTVAGGEPACCGGAGGGIVHVMIRAPAVFNQSERIDSATLGGDGSFSIVVKVYPGEPPAYAAVSAHLGSLPVGEYAHVPSIRAQDWRRDAARVGMLCFGVGLVECLHPCRGAPRRRRTGPDHQCGAPPQRPDPPPSAPRAAVLPPRLPLGAAPPLPTRGGARGGGGRRGRGRRGGRGAGGRRGVGVGQGADGRRARRRRGGGVRVWDRRVVGRQHASAADSLLCRRDGGTGASLSWHAVRRAPRRPEIAPRLRKASAGRLR